MELSSEEFRRKLHSGELMPKSNGFKFGVKRTILKPDSQRHGESRETNPQRTAESQKPQNREAKQRIHPQLSKIDAWMRDLGIRFEAEFKFSPDRKFRADRYLPDYKVLIEYEGIGFQKDGSQKKTGHTSVMGYTKDCEKYNLATESGFRVFRSTAKNYRDCKQFLQRLVKSNR